MHGKKLCVMKGMVAERGLEEAWQGGEDGGTARLRDPL
jgi:hypothetical protein